MWDGRIFAKVAVQTSSTIIQHTSHLLVDKHIVYSYIQFYERKNVRYTAKVINIDKYAIYCHRGLIAIIFAH